jgi:hypothetical protein
MGLGIYRDNLSDKEDTGEVIKIIMTDNLTPDYKNRHTIQTWIPTAEETNINSWVGSTLAESSAHEITIPNNSGRDLKLIFSPDYNFLDEEGISGIIYLKEYQVAHFYATGLYTEDHGMRMVLRTGSQDTRSVFEK